jgi:hypothetical protein
MQKVKQGSNWHDGSGKTFTVIHTIVIDENSWVHYRNQQGEEFSCFEEAFVSRFREDANDKR